MIIYNKILIDLVYEKEKIELDLANDNIKTLWRRLKDSNNYLLTFNVKSKQLEIINKKYKFKIGALEDGLCKLIMNVDDLNSAAIKKRNIRVSFVSKNDYNRRIDLIDILNNDYRLATLEKTRLFKNKMKGLLCVSSDKKKLSLDISDKIIIADINYNKY